MVKKMRIFILLFLTLIFLTTSYAVDSTDNDTIIEDDVSFSQENNVDNEIVSSEENYKEPINNDYTDNTIEDTNESSEGSDCCSVILQVSKTESAMAFRRDGTFKVVLHIPYNSTQLKQYKMGTGEFTHLFVTKDGWMIGNGGGDSVSVSKQVRQMAQAMLNNKKINYDDLTKIMNLKKYGDVGHFVIKAPNGTYAAAIYSKGKGEIKKGTLKDGDYIVVPNSRALFRTGNINVGAVSAYKNNATKATRYLALTDTYGINRREITTYHYKQDYGFSTVDIFASNDNGSFVNKKTANLRDDIEFNNKYTYASQLPMNMADKYIGTVKFNYTSPYLTKINTNLNIVVNSTNVKVKDSVNIKGLLKDKNNNVLSYQMINLTIDNKNYQMVSDKNGEISLNYHILGPNPVNIKMIYKGDIKYSNSSANYKITPKKSDVTIIAQNFTVKLGDKVNFLAKVEAIDFNEVLTDAKAVVKINSKTFGRVNVTNGYINYTMVLNPSGFGNYKYGIEFVYGGNQLTNGGRKTVVMSVIPYTPIINVNAVSAYPNEEFKLMVSITNSTSENKYGSSSGKVGFKIDGKTYKINNEPYIQPITNGSTVFILKYLKYIGTHNITVTYSGNGKFYSGKYTVVQCLTIKKYDASLNLDIQKLDNKTISIKTKITNKNDENVKINGGKVVYKLNNKTIAKSSFNDSISVINYTLPELKNNIANITVVFSHGFYESQSLTEMYKIRD